MSMHIFYLYFSEQQTIYYDYSSINSIKKINRKHINIYIYLRKQKEKEKRHCAYGLGPFAQRLGPRGALREADRRGPLAGGWRRH